MGDDGYIIKPKPTVAEVVSGYSPQVKAALIGAAVAVVVAVFGWISVYSENSKLKSQVSGLNSKVHDLEQEVQPFRNLSVQEFNKSDAASMKKLAEMMSTLRDDYSVASSNVTALRSEIEQLKKANAELPGNLYSKMAYEMISARNTNQVIWRHGADGLRIACVKLRHAPVPGSLQGDFKYDGGANIVPSPVWKNPVSTQKNVLILGFRGNYSYDAMIFDLKYMADSNETNLFKHAEFVNDDTVLLDGQIRIKNVFSQ